MTLMFAINEVEDIIKNALNKAYGYFEQGNLSEAEVLYRQILRVHPEECDALHMLALVAHRTGNNIEAIELMNKALEINPDNWEIYNNLAAAYIATNNHEKAVEYLECLKSKNPKNLHAYNNLGLVYQTLKRFDLSEKNFKAGIALKPEDFHMYFNLGNVYGDQLKFKQAIKMFRKSLELNNEFTPALWNLSSSLLLSGEWEEGWEAYESRWSQFKAFKKGRKKYDINKAWNGKESVNGKKVLIFSEQGIGDTFHFIRYAKVLKKMGAYVILECPNPKKFSNIHTLMENQDYIDEIFLHTEKIPEHDFNQAVTSFPYVFNTVLNDVLWDGPYILPSPSKCLPDKWSETSAFKIGICWGGSVVHQRDCDRSCYLKYFKTLSELQGVRLFSLQKDLRERVWPNKGKVDLASETNKMNIVDMSSYMDDFNETANVIKNMDLIISVDTAVAHLAGAMGKDVWTLLSYVPDWRWLVKTKNKSPWYPTMTLYRQPAWDDWESVFANIAKDVLRI